MTGKLNPSLSTFSQLFPPPESHHAHALHSRIHADNPQHGPRKLARVLRRRGMDVDQRLHAATPPRRANQRPRLQQHRSQQERAVDPAGHRLRLRGHPVRAQAQDVARMPAALRVALHPRLRGAARAADVGEGDDRGDAAAQEGERRRAPRGSAVDAGSPRLGQARRPDRRPGAAVLPADDSDRRERAHVRLNHHAEPVRPGRTLRVHPRAAGRGARRARRERRRLHAGGAGEAEEAGQLHQGSAALQLAGPE